MKEYEAETVMNHWYGKTWYAYGTSMTSISMGKFTPVVERFSGLILHNHGKPGGSLTPDGFDKGGVKKLIFDLEDGKKDADLITLEVLPNEGCVVGDIYDTDDQSFCGCLNQSIRFLQEHTKAQIVLILMVLENNVPPENISETWGMTRFEYARKAELVGKLNAVPVINAFAESGFGYARVKNCDYQVDHIHLNDLGGEIMGNFIWSKLKDIPPWMP